MLDNVCIDAIIFHQVYASHLPVAGHSHCWYGSDMLQEKQVVIRYLGGPKHCLLQSSNLYHNTDENREENQLQESRPGFKNT